MEANAPRGLTGKNENPLADLLGKADIGWTIARGPFAITGASTGLNISTTLNGSLRVTGQLANQGGNLTGALGGLLGDKLGGEVQKLTTRALDQRADIRGNVTVTSRPALLPNWRIEPNLTGNVAHRRRRHAGRRHQAQRLQRGEAAARQDRERADRQPVQQAAQRPHAGESRRASNGRQMCRSISLGEAAPGAPNLWLEVKPMRAFAAQPKILADWVILTLGVQAETRIVPSETKPDCPFPARLDLVAGARPGQGQRSPCRSTCRSPS